MKRFQYHQPESVEAVCALLSEHPQEAKILAGGTDLIVKMKKGLLAPKHIINIKGVRGLDSIRADENGITLGALATISEIANHSDLQQRVPILPASAQTIGSTQIRNVATLGGNLCNAAPSADMAPGLLVLEAQVRVVGPNGSRTLPLEEFFVGPEQVDLGDGEILAEVTVSHFPQTRKAIYLKHGPRKAMDTAVVGVAVAVELDASAAKCETARVGLGAVAPTPVRGREAEALMEGKTVSEISLSDVGNAIKSHIAPISDVRGSADYRLEIAANLTIRAVQRLLNLPLPR